MNEAEQEAPGAEVISDDLVGKDVIVRSNLAGVHFGRLVDCSGAGAEALVLKKSRRLWRWWAKRGISLSAVAAEGLADREELRITQEVETVVIRDYSEILECTEAAALSIRSAPVAEQS